MTKLLVELGRRVTTGFSQSSRLSLIPEILGTEPDHVLAGDLVRFRAGIHEANPRLAALVHDVGEIHRDHLAALDADHGAAATADKKADRRVTQIPRVLAIKWHRR